MDLQDKKVVVVGLGRSAVAAARLLQEKGAKPFVTELRAEAEVQTHCDALKALDIPYEAGGHSADLFVDVVLVVLSPGVNPTIPLLEEARAQSIPIISELELAWRYCESAVIAVTGTNGKTTTTELLYQMIRNCGDSVALAGNNDTPFSEAVLEVPAPKYVVLEVSSYQLESVDTFHPWIASVLNLTKDHQVRHGNMECYGAAKERIFACQSWGDIAVLNADDPWCSAIELPDGVREVVFSLEEWALDGVYVRDDEIRIGDTFLAPTSIVPIPGQHNLANALAALAVMYAGSFNMEAALTALEAFKGVEHRIEFVAEVDGVRFYNDSKATNLDSMRVALATFDVPVVLVAGGQNDPGTPYETLALLVQEHVGALVTLGEEAEKIEAAYGACVTRQVRASSMQDAVMQAKILAGEAGIVLFSPGCKSFDMYVNFEERGRDFKRCVEALSE